MRKSRDMDPLSFSQWTSINLASQDSSILINPVPLFTDLQLKKDYSQLVIISDANVYPLYGPFLIQQFPCRQINKIIIAPGERSKSLQTANYCWQELQRFEIDRHALIISLGGGVVTDLAGFVASCYMRGLDIIHVPTTLMGMVDAAIGGKTAVNFKGSKNLIGSIHPPRQVWIFSSYLQSLPAEEFSAGLAEIVKYGIIQGPQLFERLEKNTTAILAKDSQFMHLLIVECCKIKAFIVEKDERDYGIRATLNLGHTFAHAIEAAMDYQISHGHAVSIGLSCAFYTSKILGFIEQALIIRLHNLLKSLNLPLSLPEELSEETLISYMYNDKKTVKGKLNLILVKKIGSVESIEAVEPKLILTALKQKKAEKELE